MTKNNGEFSFNDGVTLKEYFQALLNGLEEKIEQARVGMEKRLDGMNEFRDALRDQSRNSPTRIEINSIFDALNKDIKELNKFKDTMSGKASQNSLLLTLLLSTIALIISVCGLSINLLLAARVFLQL